ncbi:MAG: hypothetical protein HGB01_10765 [Chlorobiaceae bacterium]|nr:hypothetical protein [Chlorobiaceae bacterium]
MMSSGSIEVFRGNTWGPFTPTLQYADGKPYVLPVGATVLFTVKDKTDARADDEHARIRKDWTSGVWSLSASDTDIPAGVYAYDIKIIGAGIELNSASGVFVVNRRITIRDANV